MNVALFKVKKRVPIVTLVMLTSVIVAELFAQVGIFRTVKAESRGEEIVVEWKSGTESGYTTFEVERRSNEVPSYRRIGSVVTKGDGSSYSFVDNGAFFRTDSEREFTYRIRAISGSGSEQYSPTVTVSHKVVSNVKRSWGMIKELFR
jgi:hypothetical protein